MFSNLKKPGHDRHGEYAKQRGDHVDDTGVFGIAPIDMGHLRDGRGNRRGSGEERYHDDGFAVLHPAGHTAQPEGDKRDQWVENEAQGHDERQFSVLTETTEVHGAYEHACDYHAQRAYHHTYGMHGQSGHFGQAHIQQEHGRSKENRQHIDVGEDAQKAYFRILLKHGRTVRPEKYGLHDKEAGGIEHPFLTEHIDHDGNDEIAGIRVKSRGLLHGVEGERLFDEQIDDDAYPESKGRRGKGKYESLHAFGRTVELIGVQHHARTYDIESHGRKHTAVLRGKELHPYNGKAHEHHEEHGGYLLAEKVGYHHGTTS